MERLSVATTSIRQWLCAHLAALVGIPASEVDMERPFSEYGIASAEGISMLVELGAFIGQSLSPTLLWDCPTIALLADALGGDAAPRIPEPVSVPEAGTVEPIAIVGMACRYPGAGGIDEFWSLLSRGEDAFTPVPADRWPVSEIYHSDPDAPGTSIRRTGGFVPGLDGFDADFFGISPREAPHVDPRQRLMLELTWEALEQAGIPREQLKGSRTGVYMAVLNDDYNILMSRRLAAFRAYTGPGTANSIVANRISYVFDLRGPSLTIDTACSGSLVALLMACRSLWSRESSLGIVGGVNLNLLPIGDIFFTKAGALSPDGGCHAFDVSANGIVRSDGAGVLVVKPLGRALEDGDPIWSVIRGGAINHDGRSNGIMAPNVEAQIDVLRDAYRNAGVSPGVVQYVEAHGTGTPLGDPIEVNALGKVMAGDRPADRALALGSVKANIGHTEAAAGIAGVIKVSLAFGHRHIPPHAHFHELNPLIELPGFPLRVPARLESWPYPDERLVAGVSGFGFGGTNAHVVMEEAPERPRRAVQGVAPWVLPLSAHSHDALRARAGALCDWLRGAGSERSMHDICYTTAMRRSHLAHRLGVIASRHDEAANALDAWLQGQEAPAVVAGTARHQDRPVVFVFSGQGTHWPGMARDLLANEPVFRDAVQEFDPVFAALGNWSLMDVLGGDGTELARTDIAQPALFAVQVGLAALWRSRGVVPDAILGQSLGEVAAAHVAGVLDARDAAAVVFHRSRLMHSVAGQGKTAVIGLPADKVELIVSVLDEVEVAGASAPETTVVSGSPAAVEHLLESLHKKNVFCRVLRGVDIAFHGRQMEPLREALVRALASIAPRAATIPLWSTVRSPVPAPESMLVSAMDGQRMDADYWGQNLRQPFALWPVVRALAGERGAIFVEIGADAALGGALQQTLRASDPDAPAGHANNVDAMVLGSMRRNKPARPMLLSSLAQLFVEGAPVDWHGLFAQGGDCVELPRYPWQRQRYWYDQLPGAELTDTAAHSQAAGTSPLLGPVATSTMPAKTQLWSPMLGGRTPHYLGDHQILGSPVMPGAAYVEMILAAAAQVFPGHAVEIRDLQFERALRLPAERAVAIHVELTPEGPDKAVFEVHGPAGDSGRWVRHAVARLQRMDREKAADTDPASMARLDEIRTRCREVVAVASHYESMERQGASYGPSFRPLVAIQVGPREGLTHMRLPASLHSEADVYTLHPVLMDAAIQSVAPVMTAMAGPAAASHSYLPAGLGRVVVHRAAGDEMWCHVMVDPDVAPGDPLVKAELCLFDGQGTVIAEVAGLTLRRVDMDQAQIMEPGQILYDLAWSAMDTDAGEPGETSAQPWLILADRQGVGDALATALRARGHGCRTMYLARTNGSRSHDATGVEIDPGNRAAAIRALEDACAALGNGTLRIAVLWALDVPDVADVSDNGDDGDALSADALLARVRADLCMPIAQLVQALLEASEVSARVVLITRNSQAVAMHRDSAAPQHSVSPVQAAVWGLGRVLAAEHHELWGGLVDLPHDLLGAQPDNSSDHTAAHINLLIAALDRPAGEDQLAVREGALYRPRLVRASLGPTTGMTRLRRDATYLITGGFTGLGAATAHWLVEQGARRLCLVGRTSLPERGDWAGLPAEHPAAERVALVRALEARGASVHVAAVDVSDQAALAAMLDRYQREGWPPIKGVIHSAGALRDTALWRITEADFDTVLSSKVAGAWALHRAFMAENLDFFVLFSSVTSVLGRAGQANYAAGNAFMDALARYRRGQGLPATCINWGPWSEVGMFAREGTGDMALRAISPRLGMEAMALILDSALPQVVAVDGDFARLPPIPMLAELRPRGEMPGDTDEAEPALDLQLLLMEPQDRVAAIEAVMKETCANILQTRGQVDTYRPLLELGMDSLMILEFKRAIDGRYGVKLSMLDLFGRTIAQLASDLATKLQDDTRVLDLLEQIESMSMEHVGELLASGGAEDSATE